MKNYIGIKLIQAKPMTRGLYNSYRGWTLPADENPADAGYLVVYPDGYESWSPKRQFEDAYLDVSDENFTQKSVDRFNSLVDMVG
jgi:hypothetical protein